MCQSSPAINPFSMFKVLCHRYRLVENRFYGPVTATIDLTNQCNHQCIWCHSRLNRLKNPMQKMDRDIFRKCIDELSINQTQALILSGGGDPTCHPQLNEFLEYALDKKVQIGLVTNGAWLDQIDPTLICRIRYIRISLDAGSERTHQRLHRPIPGMGWDKIMDNIRKLGDSKPSSLSIGIGYLIHPENVDEIPSIALILRELDVDYLQLRPIKYTGQHIDTQAIKRAFILAKQYERPGFIVVESGSKYENEYRPIQQCHILPLVLNISTDGTLYPCCELREYSNYAYGNLESSSIQAILNSDRALKIRESIRPSACPDCKYVAMNHLLESIANCDPLHMNFL